MFIPRALETVLSLRSVPLSLKDERRQEIVRDLPDLMDSMVRYMDTGSSLEDALDTARMTLRRPLSDEIDMVSLLMDAGTQFEDALKAVSQKLDLAEFDILVTACTAPDRARTLKLESLKKVAIALRERNETRELATSSERETTLFAALLGGVFLATFGTMYVINREYASLLFTPAGGAIFTSSLALMMIGLALICVTGRIEPGMDSRQVRQHAATFGSKVTLPVALTVLPAMIFLSFGPAIIRMFGG